MSNPVVIDPETCVGCGRCVDVCPAWRLVLEGGKAIVSGTKCMACGHCEAVCPEGAISLPGHDANPVGYRTIQVGEDWVPYGEYDAAALVSLMRSRRSCRRFLDTPVERDVLEDLARIGSMAPSGTNSQRWTFTVLPDRSSVVALSGGVQRFFKRLNRLARIPLLRLISRIGSGALDTYYRKHSASVEEALVEWEERGNDRLFFGAPAAILVGSRPGGSTPAEDALLATENILLAAHAMGLGTCLIGFAVAAMSKDPAIGKGVGLPGEEVIHAVIAVGHTDRIFCRVTRRPNAEVRFLQL